MGARLENLAENFLRGSSEAVTLRASVRQHRIALRSCLGPYVGCIGFPAATPDSLLKTVTLGLRTLTWRTSHAIGAEIAHPRIGLPAVIARERGWRGDMTPSGGYDKAATKS